MNNSNINSIHSRYNPCGEAERYIASLSLNENIRFFILIEPGLGYLTAPLRKRNPHSKIIALHAGSPARAQGEEAPDSQWHPGLGISVQDFLDREIPDSEASKIKILEWRPALPVYGGAYLSLVEESAKFIKRADANYRTLKIFGRCWFRNLFRNLQIIRNVVRPRAMSIPLVITGAGPGLEEQIPLLRKASNDGKIFILAVSSSVAALEAGSAAPDMVISTDGGGWARFHLHECIRSSAHCRTAPSCGASAAPVSGGFPLAAAITASLPSQCAGMPVLPIADGSVWQTTVLKALDIPFITLPQRGTVTASALDLAFALTKGPVYIAGLDLANRDIRSHARPYSLDYFQEEREARLNPYYSMSFKRSLAMNEGNSFGIYASWFEKQLSSYPKRLFSLGDNNIVFGALKASDAISGAADSRETMDFASFRLEEESASPLKALNVLEKALRDPLQSEKLSCELSALLFPGMKPASGEELITALEETGRRLKRSPPGDG